MPESGPKSYILHNLLFFKCSLLTYKLDKSIYFADEFALIDLTNDNNTYADSANISTLFFFITITNREYNITTDNITHQKIKVSRSYTKLLWRR